MITSQRYLFCASILAFGFLAISQWGTDWEVSPEIIKICMIILVASSILFLVSIISLLISLKTFCKIATPFKIVYFIWMAMIIGIYIIGWSGKIWEFVDVYISQMYKYAFIPGLIISTALSIIIKRENKRIFKDD